MGLAVLGALVFVPAGSLSWTNGWIFLALMGVAMALVVRTHLEDRTLRHELPGDEASTRETRYRLLPGFG